MSILITTRTQRRNGIELFGLGRIRLEEQNGGARFCERMNRLERCEEQHRALDEFLQDAGERDDRLQYEDGSIESPAALEREGDAGDCDTIAACEPC